MEIFFYCCKAGENVVAASKARTLFLNIVQKY